MEKPANSSSIDEFFNSRQELFLVSLERALSSIGSDDKIRQMFHNPNIANYLPARITELISSILQDDREAYIQTLTNRLRAYEEVDDRGQYRSPSSKIGQKRLNRQLKVVKSIKTINNSIYSTVSTFSNEMRLILSNARNSVSTAIDSLVHDNKKLNNRLESLNRRSKTISRENEDLKRQLSISQDNLSRSQKQYNELTEILDSKENDLANMKSINYNLSSSISNSRNYNTSQSTPYSSQKRKAKSNSFLSDRDFNDSFGFNNGNNDELLTEYKQKLDDAYQQIQNLKSQLQVNDQGEMMQSLVYASQTIKTKDQQIQELQNHIKDLNKEVQSLGNQIQALTVQGTSPTKRVTFPDLSQNNDRYCSYDEFEHMMNERNDLADQLEAIQSETSKREKQKKLLESKINDLMQQKTDSERQFHSQLQELQEKNKQLSLNLKDSSNVNELLNKEKSDSEQKSVIIRQKDALIQSLTKENAKLIGQFSVLSRIDEQSKNNEDLSLEVLLDSANFDPQQKKIISKIFNESQKRNDQKISKLEQALRNRIKSENALKQDIEKANLNADNNQKLIELKQRQIEDLNVSSSQLQNEKSQNETKVAQLNRKIAELENKIEELENSLSSKQKQIDDFRSIFESFKVQKESLEEKINQIQQEKQDEVKRLQTINTDISEQSFMKEREAEKAQRTNQQLTEEIQKVKSQNEQLVLINKQSQEQIENSKSIKQKLESYKKAHQESKKQLTILASSNQQLQNKLKAKRNQVSSQVELINKLQKTIDSVNSEKNTVINDLQKKMKQLEEENMMLKSNTITNRQIEFPNNSIPQFNASNTAPMNTNTMNSQMFNSAELNSNLKSLQRQLELSQDAKESAEKQISALQSENENLLNSIQKTESEKEKLNQSISELNSNLSKIQIENQKQIDANNKLQIENRKLQYEKEQHQEENNKLQKENSKLEIGIQRQQEENNRLQNDIQRHQEENNKLQNTNNKLQMGVKNQQEENSKLQSSNNKLQKNNSKQQEQIEKLQEEFSKSQKLNEKQTEENNRLKRTSEKQQDDIIKLQNEIENQKEAKNNLQNENKKLQKNIEKQNEENNKLQKINERQIFENEQLHNVNDKQQEDINELHKINDSIQRELQAKTKQNEEQAHMISELQTQLHALTTTHQKVLKKSSRIVNVSEITQIPSKLDELNTIIVKIRELLNLKKSEDVISAIVNLLRQIQNACQNLSIRDPNDFQNATLILAKEIEENRKFKEDFSRREQKIQSVLTSSYSFETIPETLIKYQKSEQEIINILRCQNASVISSEVQSLVKFESSIEKSLGCSTKEEAVKDTIQLKTNEKIIEKILGIEDVTKIPRAIEDLFNDVQQLKKSLGIDDFHTAIPAFIQVYTNLKKVMKNSESFEKIFADLLEIVMSSKQVNKILQAQNLDESIQSIQMMKETIMKTESEIDSKSIEGESLPQKVAEMSNRCRVLNQAVKILDVDDYGSVIPAIQLLLEEFNQVKSIVINGKSMPITSSQFSKSGKFGKLSPNSDNQEIIQEVANMKSECLNLAQILNVSEDSIVPKCAELLDQMKQISAVFVTSKPNSNSMYQIKPNSSSFNAEIIGLVNKQNQQIQKMSEILSSNPEKIVESVARMNQQVRKISEIISPNEDHLHNEALVDLIMKQNQQMKKISAIFSPNEDHLHNEALVDLIMKQNQQMKKISEMFLPNEDHLHNEALVELIFKQNQQMKKISEIFSPNEDHLRNEALVELIMKQNQQMKKISDIISPNGDHLHNEALVELIMKQNQQLKKISEIISSNEDYLHNEALVDLILKENQQLKKISEVYNNSESFIEEIIQQNQQIKSISEIYSPSNDIVNNVFQDHQQIMKINEIYPDSSNIVEDVTINNMILQKISAKMAKDNDSNRNQKKKNDFSDLIGQVSSLRKQVKQISKILQSPSDSIVKTIDEIYTENLKNNEIIQKTYQIINTETPEEVFDALESFVNITKILKVDQNVPQKVNEMKTIIEETSSILPNNESQSKKSKKQNNNENIDLINQAKQAVSHLNYLSDAIHNLSELINNDDNSSNNSESSDLLYSKVETMKKNSESMNEILTSIQEKLNNNDLNSIEDDIDSIQEDLSVKNMLLNSVASSISSSWNPFKPNDLKEFSSQQNSPNSPFKRKTSQTKTINELKINQFEKLYDQFTELKKEFDSVLKSNATQPFFTNSNDNNNGQKKGQNKDLISSMSIAIQIIKDKANLIQKLVSAATPNVDGIEEEEEDNEYEVKDYSSLVQKVTQLRETVSGISDVLETHGNETELIKNVQDLVDRLNMNEATFSLQSCEFETLSTKAGMNEGLIGRLCQITGTNDANSLIKRVFDLDKENKALQKILNSQDIASQTQSIWLILTSISHILDVDKSKLPDEIQKLVNENERLAQCTNQIDQILISENNMNFSQNQSQRIILSDKLRVLPLKVQQLLNERDSLRSNVEQIKDAVNEPEEFIEKVQNMFQREVKIERILNLEPQMNFYQNQSNSDNISSSNLNEIIPETVAKLYEFHENALQLFKPQNKENLIEEIASLLNDNEERKKIMDSLTQILSHDNENFERTEDLVDLDLENESQTIDLINEVQNLHDSNIQMKRYIDELSSVAGISPTKKTKKFKLNNSNDNMNITPNLSMNVKQKQRSNLVSFSPIRPKQAQTLNPNIKQKKTNNNSNNSGKDLIQVVAELRDKEREVIEIVGKDHQNNYIEQIAQMKNALNSIHQLIFDPMIEEEEEDDEPLVKSSSIDNLNLNSFQQNEHDEEDNIETYESYINKINQNLSEITKMKAQLEYIQKTTNNDSNYIQKVGNVFDQMRQIRKILKTENDSEIPQFVANLVKTRDSIDQILTTSKQMVSTEAIERSQSSIKSKSTAKTVNISTQTVTQQEEKLIESDLPSRVQEIVEMNSEFQDQINEICSILPESENVINDIRTMKENEEKLKKIFKSNNLVESAIQHVQTRQSIESMINDLGGNSKENQNGLVSFISQLIGENEQRKQIIEVIQRETEEENNYIEKIKQMKQDEQKIQEILRCRSDLPTVTAKFVETVDSISQIIFDSNGNDSESDSENENENQTQRIDHSNLINEIQTIFNSFNRMKKELNDLNSIMDSNNETEKTNQNNKELIKATKEMKKRENELKSIFKTDDLIFQANRLTQTINSIQKSVNEYHFKVLKEVENQQVLENFESDDEKDTLNEINYDELINQVETHLSELLSSRLTISKIQKATNETENYEEKIANIMSIHRKIDSILNNSEHLPFSPITLKNTPAAVEYLVETQNEVYEILSSIDFNENEDEDENEKSQPKRKNSKSNSKTDIKKKEQKVTQIPSKVQLLADKSKVLDSINEEFLNEEDFNNIPDQISTLINNSKVLVSIGNTLNIKKPPQIIEKVANQVEQLNQLKQMLSSENVIKSVDNLQKENFQYKETNQKINEILSSFNESTNSNPVQDEPNGELIIDEIQNILSTINELSNEKQTISKILNNENPIEEIESLQNLKEKLQQLLPRKGIIQEVQKLIQTSQISQKSAKILGCQNLEFVPEKINEMKEIIKRYEEESETMNDLLKSNSMPNSISKVKNLTSILHDPEDLNDEVSGLIESLKKAEEELSNRETQERATINDLQASLIQIMRLTDKKTTSEAIGQVEETEEIVKRLQKVLQVSEPSKIPLRVDSLLSERAKIIMNIDTNYMNLDQPNNQSKSKNNNNNQSISNEFDFGLDNYSTDENNNNSTLQDTTLIYLDNDELPQCIYNMKRGIRENENILKRIAEITKFDLNGSKNTTNNNSVNPIDFSQIPRVVAEICQSSQLIKSIHTIMTDQDISDQMPETIQKLIQDSAELTVLTKENEELKRNYEDTCNFVKRLLSIIMEGHLPQKVKFPIPLKAKDKLLEFLRSFKKRSDRNAADIKVILKRASSNGYRDTDLIEAVNCIVDESIAFEKQTNNEDMHEKTKSLKQIIERQNQQYNAMMTENKQAVLDLKDKIEEIQRQASEKENKIYLEGQKKLEKLAEATAELDKEKRIHGELIRLISKQSIDTDFLSINLPVNEMRIVFQYTK